MRWGKRGRVTEVPGKKMVKVKVLSSRSLKNF